MNFLNFFPAHKHLTRLLQLVSIFQNVVVPLERGRNDPTQLLPLNFLSPPNIRQGKEHLEDQGFPQVPPKVRMEGLGDVEGYFLRVVSGRHVYAFEGIPYAEPPTGSNRFKAPVMKRAWNGTLSVKSWPSMCTQTRTRRPGIHGNENCLWINIYTPELPRKDGHLLPIIFFIHGGAYAVGSSNEYGPSYLMSQDIVLVTVNYRLGVFGFLSTGTTACAGNWGLKDQAMAINFVHKHAHNYGGDANRLVLMGQSAGAVSVHLHLMSPLSRDKIFAAVSLSGTAFMPWALRKATEEKKLARRLAAVNLCPSYLNVDDNVMLNCLRSRSTTNITLAAALLMVSERKVFEPVIEPEHPGAFITKTPSQYYAEGSVAKVPFIATMTSRELEITLAVKLARIESLPQFRFFGPPVLAFFSPVLLDYQDKVENVEQVTRRIFNYYGGEQKISTDSAILAQIASDRHFAMGLRKALNMHRKIAPTYSYYFSYNNDLGFADELKLNPYEFGVPHGEDLLFLFNRTDRRPISRHQGHFAVVQLLQTLLINFASTGEPLYTDEKFNDHRIWEAVETDQPVPFLRIDREVKMTSIPEFNAATDFWNSLGIQDQL